MQVPVWVAGAGGVVPHHHRLQRLDRDGDLRPARPDPGGGVLAEPADDLPRGPVLRRLIRCRDIGVQLRRERPRLRPVHHHLNEPHRICVGAQPAARLAGLRVQAGDPRLVPVTGQRRELDHRPVRSGGVPPRHPGPLGQVVVIRTGPIRLHIIAGSRRPTPVYLHPTMHLPNHFK
jgi:hypothetical protein